MEPIYTRIYTQPVEFNYAIGYAYDALVRGPYPFDAMAAWKGLSERIGQGIYMGQGLLLPHTRVPGLKGPLMAFVVCRDGFTGIKTRNEETAQFICMLLSPAESATAHTQVIAGMAKLLLNPEWKKKALAVKCNEDVKLLF